jgi:hypothetical protein
MKQAWEVAVAYKLVWVRVLLMLVMPMITSYLTITQQIDLDVKWPTMGTFARWGFWLGIIAPAFGIFIAFIDQSLNRAKLDLEKKRSGNTQIFVKETES